MNPAIKKSSTKMSTRQTPTPGHIRSGPRCQRGASTPRRPDTPAQANSPNGAICIQNQCSNTAPQLSRNMSDSILLNDGMYGQLNRYIDHKFCKMLPLNPSPKPPQQQLTCKQPASTQKPTTRSTCTEPHTMSLPNKMSISFFNFC